MSRKTQNTLFITLNILAIISLNIFMISCDEIKKSTINKNNMLIEVTSEPQFFKAVQETLDSFDKGVFISYDYSETEDSDTENYEEENYENDYYTNFDKTNEELLEVEYFEEMDIEQLEQLEKELESYDFSGKSQEELLSKLNQITGIISKLKNGLEESNLSNNENFETEISSSDDDDSEYFNEDDQNALIREYAFSQLSDKNLDKIEDWNSRNIKKLSVLTMFHMETEVKINLNNLL